MKYESSWTQPGVLRGNFLKEMEINIPMKGNMYTSRDEIASLAKEAGLKIERMGTGPKETMKFQGSTASFNKLKKLMDDWTKAIRPEIAHQYSQIPNTHLYFKFVVMDEQDIEEVDMARKAYSDKGVEADIYLMPLGATVEGQAKTSKQVAEICLKYGYKFSPRLHVDLFGNKWGT